jgi:predicted DNA-binding transcriptional regulator AlpA
MTPFSDRNVRMKEASRITGLSTKRLYALHAEGKFVPIRKLAHGGRASGVLLSELRAWMEFRYGRPVEIR